MNMPNKFSRLFSQILSALLIFSFLSSASFAPIRAQDADADSETGSVNIELGQYYTLSDGTAVSEAFAKPSDMINLLVRVIFVLAGVFLFGMIIVAGFSLISGGSKDAEKAKSTITTAIIGFIIMFAAYWILQIVQLLTGLELGF